MRLPVLVLCLAGLLAATGLVIHAGAASVGDAMGAMGFGLLALVAWHAVPLACSALAWQRVMAGRYTGTFARFLEARLVRQAVNNLLPSAHLGGDLVGARLLAWHGAPPAAAVAGAVIDKTIEILAQLVFTLVGLALLAGLTEHGDKLGRIGVGAAFLALGLAIYIVAQRYGLFRLFDRLLVYLGQRLQNPALGGLASLHAEILALHREPGRWLRAGTLHFASWLTGAGEIWLALHFLGIDAPLVTCLILESLGQAVRSAGFVVPGALGVQEGGYVMIGAWFGLDPATALALSLAKRVRELALGVPALLYWHLLESRRLLARNRSGG